jgi:hypothetical protein
MKTFAAMQICAIQIVGCAIVAQAAVLRHQHADEIAVTHDKVKMEKHFLQAGSSSGRWEPPWEDSSHHQSLRLQCGITEQVGAHTDKYEDCPADCPYFAQNRKDADFCTFLCVPGNECGKWNPNKPIPDSIKNTKTCRGPKVAFCREPTLDGKDTCAKCQSGFALHHDDGQCYFDNWTVIIIGFAVVGILFAVVIAWFTDMCIREPVNHGAVAKAEAWRSRSKILDRSKRPITTFDIDTNLCETSVAGPGMLLHFRFQRFFIIWPLCCAIVWTCLAIYEPDLFILGTRKFGTPRHNCILVAWGYETQQRLMWTKVLFLAIVYVGSFISFLWFSVSQLRKYKQMDLDEKSMKDFALELKGMPHLPGNHTDVEQDIKKAVETAIGKPGVVVGVSVAWNYQSDDGEKQELIEYLCQKDLTWRQREWELELKHGRKPSPKDVQDILDAERVKQQSDPSENYGAIRKKMYAMEKSVLGPEDDKCDEVPEEVVDKEGHLTMEFLKDLKSSDTAFIVFNTEADKAEAIGKEIEFKSELAKKYGLESSDAVLMTLTDVSNEPANINWHNFGESAMLFNFFKGFFKVYVPALLIWFFAFYVPYAYSLYNFNYDNGAELPGYYSIIFTIVVCGGNATMYVVCDVCCDIIGFRYKDTKQVTYMLMYLVACMINVFLDMVVTYYTALKVMVGLDFRTYDGRRLADIDVFTEQFETYAMQRSLGANTFSYAWPSTFFLCFVLEPFVTIMVPYYVCKVLIKSHREIRGVTAENYLMAFEFDLGRYADILLNVFLGIVIFYFPGGYIWSLFYAMCFSHCFIYCFDHWRVLKVIPYVRIVSMEVDWWAQLTMGFCCAVILSCLVFKMNCETYAGYCMQEMELISATTIAGVAHFIVHSLLLIYVVPKLVSEGEDKLSDTTFKEVAKRESRTWFSVNPVHCLRSKHLHKHSPHCRLASWGKEHLLENNDKIGCYYTTEAAVIEDFDFRKSIKDALKKESSTPRDEPPLDTHRP